MPALVPTDATESASALVPPDPSRSGLVPPGARSTSEVSAQPPDPPEPHAPPRAGPTWRGADPRSAWPRSLDPTVAPSAVRGPEVPVRGVTAPRSSVGTHVVRPSAPLPPEPLPGISPPTGGGMDSRGHPHGFPRTAHTPAHQPAPPAEPREVDSAERRERAALRRPPPPARVHHHAPAPSLLPASPWRLATLRSPPRHT